MASMNEMSVVIKLREFMDSPEGWGRSQGRIVYPRLIEFVESHAGTLVFRVSFAKIDRIDISFASETIVELARRFRGLKGFCLVELTDTDMIENVEAAAQRKSQPLVLLSGKDARVLGVEPSQGTVAALQFASKRSSVRSAEFVAATPGMTIANASMKFKQLWEQGFLLRREEAAETGGIEYVYYRIG